MEEEGLRTGRRFLCAVLLGRGVAPVCITGAADGSGQAPWMGLSVTLDGYLLATDSENEKVVACAFAGPGT